MPRIEQSFIEALLDKAEISEVVSRYTTLNKKGDRYWACCPFHSEKTPSFSVSPEKQLYYCFGCGKGGGIINFIMEAERLEFSEAVSRLAEMYGMEIPNDVYDPAADLKKRILEMNAEAARFFHNKLLSPEGKNAIEYLKKRAIQPATVTRFGIGYAPAGWDNLTRFLRGKGFTDSEMKAAGLVRKGSNGGSYDVFRDRLMFPIIDPHGKVLAFGGRVLSGEEKGQKYLNTEDTPVFSKKTVLFGYNYASKSAEKRIILVEGYMDVVSLHQAGFTNTVASLGTALTKEHAKLLGRRASEVIVAYDTDKAGTNATAKAIDIFSAEGMMLRILRVPGGKDPDEFVRNFGGDEFRKVLDASEQQMDYRLRLAAQGLDMTSDIGKIEYLKKATELLSTIDSEIETEVYAGRVAAQAGISTEACLREITKIKKEKQKTVVKKQWKEESDPARLVQPPRESGIRYQSPVSASLEEQLISLLCSFPNLVSKASEKVKPEDFSSKELGLIYEKMISMGSFEVSELNRLYPLLEKESCNLLGKIISGSRPHSGTEEELNDICSRIRKDDGTEDPLLALVNKKRKKFE